MIINNYYFILNKNNVIINCNNINKNAINGISFFYINVQFLNWCLFAEYFKYIARCHAISDWHLSIMSDDILLIFKLC